MPEKKLGKMLLENGLIDKVQLNAALRKQKEWGGKLGANLIELGIISEIKLLKFLRKQLNYPCADLSKFKISQEAYSLISVHIAEGYHVIPLLEKESGGKKFLFLAMSDPTNIMVNNEIHFITDHIVKPVIATYSQIESAIEKYYHNDEVHIRPLSGKVPVIRQEEI